MGGAPVENLGACFLPLKEVPAGLWPHPGSHVTHTHCETMDGTVPGSFIGFWVDLFFKTPPPVNWQTVFCIPSGGLQDSGGHAGFGQPGPLPALAAGWTQAAGASSSMQGGTRRAALPAPEQPCTSSVPLHPNEEGAGRAIFIFSRDLGGGGRTLHHVI